MEDEAFSLYGVLAAMKDHAAPGGDNEEKHIRADSLMATVLHRVARQHILSEGSRAILYEIADVYISGSGHWWYV